MIATALVFVGGGLGAAARHGVNLLAARLIGVDFPWGTLIVNVAGSIAMGLLAAWFGTKPLRRRFTDVYVFEDGKWLFLARQASAVREAKRFGD